MKSMTCNQLGGACDQVFEAETFDEIAGLSRAHGQQMGEQNDPAHLEAMSKMQTLMQDPAAMQEWMDQKRTEFDSL